MRALGDRLGNRDQDVNFVDLQGREYIDALQEKINTYRDDISRSGRSALWQLSLGAFYGASQDGKCAWAVTPGGEYGELVQMKVNEYASLLRHQLVLAIQNRPAGIAKAINTDTETLRNARIGTLLVEYYLSDPKHMFEIDYVQALELALATAEAFVVQSWDTFLGEPMTAGENDEEIFSGDLVQDVYPVWNTARDIGLPNPNKSPWFIFSKRANKFELAAKYPAFREDILLYSRNSSAIRPPVIFQVGTDNTDYVEQHLLIHLPTMAKKEGRISLMIGDCMPFDGPYPYPAKCFHRISDREIFETAFGHTSNYDLLALEQVTDNLHSIALNNLSTFGVNTIVGPKGGGVSFQELAKGLRYIELDPALVDKLKVLELASVRPEIFNYGQALSQMKGQLSGINSILRGDPQGQLKGASGSAMALLQSQAISFNSGIQKSFYNLLNSGGTGTIEILRKYADDERIVRIAGKSNAQAIKEFKFDAETLKSVSTVVFEAVNPILQTASGKLTIADNLLQAGMLTNPKRYIEVLTTGNLNVLIEDDVAMEEAMLEENEHLVDGEQVEAIITEMHEDHIRAHQAVISTPNAKKDPMLVTRVLQHIQQHIQLWQQASMQNPSLLLATRQKVLPPPPGMAPPGAPAPGMGGPPPQDGQAPQLELPAGPQAKPEQPSLPKPPQDPFTGQAAPVAPGTSVR